MPFRLVPSSGRDLESNLHFELLTMHDLLALIVAEEKAAFASSWSVGAGRALYRRLRPRPHPRLFHLSLSNMSIIFL